MSYTPYDIPPQESKEKWFRSHLLGREVELGELYSLGFNELDLIMAETAEIRSDIEFKEKNIGKFRTAGYFLELAKIIEKRTIIEPIRRLKVNCSSKIQCLLLLQKKLEYN